MYAYNIDVCVKYILIYFTDTSISVLPRKFRVVVGFYIAFSAVYPVYT